MQLTCYDAKVNAIVSALEAGRSEDDIRRLAPNELGADSAQITEALRRYRRTYQTRAPRHKAIAATLTLVLSLVTAPSFAADAAGVVNVNTASASELALLPRVGPAIAARVIEHREKNGNFQKVEDLLLVPGIGEKTLALMAPYLTLSGPTTLKEKVRASKPPTQQAGTAL